MEGKFYYVKSSDIALACGDSAGVMRGLATTGMSEQEWCSRGHLYLATRLGGGGPWASGPFPRHDEPIGPSMRLRFPFLPASCVWR